MCRICFSTAATNQFDISGISLSVALTTISSFCFVLGTPQMGTDTTGAFFTATSCCTYGATGTKSNRDCIQLASISTKNGLANKQFTRFCGAVGIGTVQKTMPNMMFAKTDLATVCSK